MLRDWIYFVQLLMAAVHFIDTRTIQEIEKTKSELCTPVNISVVLTQWQPICVTLHWSCAYTQANGELFYVNLSSLKKLTKDKDRIIASDELTSFRISYSAYNSEFRFTQIVPAYINKSNLDNLQPNTKYTLTISSISANNQIGVTSREVDFVAPAVAISQFNTNTYNSIASLRLDTDDTINVKAAEVIVVVVVLCCWLYVIVFFVKKWGKYLWGIRSMEPIIGQARIRSGKTTVLDTDSLNGTSSVPTKSRLQSFANITLMPKIHMSESNNSLYSDHQSLLGANCKHHLTVNARPRLNSFFLTSPSRRDSFMPDENRLPRRYKSAEDLQSLVLEITEAQRQQRKLSQISIKEADQMHLDNCTLINNLGSNGILINHSGSFTNQQYSGSNTTRGSLTTSATSRGSNGTIKLDNLATVAIAASNSQYKQRIASPSKSSSSERGGIICSSSGTTCTTSSANSKQSASQNKSQSQFKKNSIGIQVESSDSNQATIASCERDLDPVIAINCSYCRRRMSNCDECTHCNSLNMSTMPTMTNRNLVLMQSRSFINHTCSSENSSFENNPLTSSTKNLSTAGTSFSATNSNSPSGNGHRTSQQCLFQISETSDDIKHIDEE